MGAKVISAAKPERSIGGGPSQWGQPRDARLASVVKDLMAPPPRHITSCCYLGPLGRKRRDSTNYVRLVFWYSNLRRSYILVSYGCRNKLSQTG